MSLKVLQSLILKIKQRADDVKGYIIKAAIALLFIIPVYLYIPYQNPEDIKLFINGFGASAPLIFIAVCAIKPVIFFLPSMGLIIVAGALFGPIYGTLYVVIGGAVSTVIGFYMTRMFGRKTIERLFKNWQGMLEMNEKMKENGFKTTLYLRLFNLPWDLVSYSAGISSIRFKDFYAASLVALVPNSFIYTYFGSSILNPLSPGFIISLSVIIILGSLPYILKNYDFKK